MNETPAPPSTTKLAALATSLLGPDLEPGTVTPARLTSPTQGIWGYVEYSPEVRQLIEVAYEDGWVLVGFNWSQWARTEEAQALHDDPKILEKASIEQLAKLFTVVIRQDRFVEGAILASFESGLLPRMLERVLSIDRSSMPTS